MQKTTFISTVFAGVSVVCVVALVIITSKALASQGDICDSGCVPLMDMTAGQTYFGEDGGLYGNYSNTPPPAHVTKINEAKAAITPRDANGTPNANGKIVLLTIGMSNTRMKADAMIGQAAGDQGISNKIVIVNGARGSVTAERWAINYQNQWDEYVPQMLANAGVTAEQVQALWIEITDFAPSGSCSNCMANGGSWVNTLTQNLKLTTTFIKSHFPNAELVFMSNRSYGGYGLVDLNDEPYAYETGIAVRRTILAQVNGTDPLVSYANVPVLVWGAQLWADDNNPNSEGLAWTADDFTAMDGIHPVEDVPGKGAEKAAQKILSFFKTSPYTIEWFASGSTQTPTPSPTPTSGPTPTLSPTPTATPTPGTPSGDINNDGKINGMDLGRIINAWGTSNASADVNDDGVVNLLDLVILISGWGQV